MRDSARRAVIALVLAPYLAVSGALAPEHVHEADADHPHSTIHRHLDPHVAQTHDPDHAEFADDDDHVVWLDGAATLCQCRYQLSAPQLLPAETFALISTLVDWLARPDYETPPPHGPPKTCLAPRAPPLPPA